MRGLPVPKQDSLQAYLHEIQSFPLLSPEEERELARLWREGENVEAAHRLVTSNLRFVVKVANQYRGYGLRLADLVQEGNIGLMKAVYKFDPDRKIRLISYAVWWIRAYIQSFILRSWSLVKLGTTQAQRKLFFSLSKAKREIQRLDSTAEEESDETSVLADRLGVGRDDILEMNRRLSGRDASLSTPVGEGGDESLGDFVQDGCLSQEDAVERNEVSREVAARIQAALDTLDRRERYIVEHRLLAEEPMLLREIGHQFGVSRERARQIEAQARKKLRKQLADLADHVPSDGEQPQLALA